MSTRRLFGDDTPIPDTLGILWVAAAGWAMGTTALGTILTGPPFEPAGTLGLMVIGLAPASLSAAAAWLGTRGRGIGVTIALTMVGSLLTAVFCPAVTLFALALTGVDISAPNVGDGFIGTLAVVSIFGGIFAVPLGVLFGLIYSVALSTLRLLQDRVRSRSDVDLALIVLGLGLCVVSLACVGFMSAYPAMSTGVYPSAPAPFTALWTCVTTASAGILAAVFGAGRLFARGAFTTRAARGGLSGWAVVSADEINDAGALPRLFPFGNAEHVLIRRDETAAGPFRSGETSTPMLRV